MARVHVTGWRVVLVPCWHCDGSGKITIWQHWKVRQVVCPECQGKGSYETIENGTKLPSKDA